MSGKSSPNPVIFLFKTELPVNLCMSRSAVSATTSIAELLSLSSESKYALEVSVEEAFSNAVQHFSKDDLTGESITITYTIKASTLIISIQEKGIPFSSNSEERYTPDSLNDMEKPGLGTYLMEKMMDSVEFIVHGREGKETILKKQINTSLIPPELVHQKSTKSNKKRITVKNALCREAEESDLADICRLAWKCYGYTQENLLYDLDLLTEKFINGEIKPIIFIDPDSGNIIAHEALKYHDQKVKVPELSLVFIDPAYRCPKLTIKFAEEIRRVSLANGDRGIFSCSVTTHIFSQKGSQQYMGASPCALMLGIAAAGMQARELKTSIQEKGTVINHYLPFDKSRHTLYLPERHKSIIQKIYQWMDLPRDYAVASKDKPDVSGDVISFSLPEELNVNFIIVNTIGNDTTENIAMILRNCKEGRKDSVYIFIPTGTPFSAQIVEECERLGFFFAGIMPHIHDGDDRIILQYLNININPNNIRIFGKESKELFNYVMNEKEKSERRI